MRIPKMHKGWLRLGVVASALWMLGVTSIAVYQYLSMAALYAGWEDVSRGTPWEVNRSFAVCGTIAGDHVAQCFMHREKVLNLAVLPVISVWPILLALLVGYRWIKDGFASERAKP